MALSFAKQVSILRKEHLSGKSDPFKIIEQIFGLYKVMFSSLTDDNKVISITQFVKKIQENGLGSGAASLFLEDLLNCISNGKLFSVSNYAMISNEKLITPIKVKMPNDLVTSLPQELTVLLRNLGIEDTINILIILIQNIDVIRNKFGKDLDVSDLSKPVFATRV